jgi:hypothetical protein
MIVCKIIILARKDAFFLGFIGNFLYLCSAFEGAKNRGGNSQVTPN